MYVRAAQVTKLAQTSGNAWVCFSNKESDTDFNAKIEYGLPTGCTPFTQKNTTADPEEDVTNQKPTESQEERQIQLKEKMRQLAAKKLFNKARKMCYKNPCNNPEVLEILESINFEDCDLPLRKKINALLTKEAQKTIKSLPQDLDELSKKMGLRLHKLNQLKDFILKMDATGKIKLKGELKAKINQENLTHDEAVNILSSVMMDTDDQQKLLLTAEQIRQAVDEQMEQAMEEKMKHPESPISAPKRRH